MFHPFWKKSNVIPIQKNSSLNSIELDLRPISLTATVSKVFEKLIGQRVLESLTNRLDPR